LFKGGKIERGHEGYHMVKVTATEARNNIGKLWSTAAKEPVMVEAAGKPLAVVLSPDEYARLTQPHIQPRIAGTGMNVLTRIDVNALLDTEIGRSFSEYVPL
jgi:prevent-host-death family protein